MAIPAREKQHISEEEFKALLGPIFANPEYEICTTSELYRFWDRAGISRLFLWDVVTVIICAEEKEVFKEVTDMLFYTYQQFQAQLKELLLYKIRSPMLADLEKGFGEIYDFLGLVRYRKIPLEQDTDRA